MTIEAKTVSGPTGGVSVWCSDCGNELFNFSHAPELNIPLLPVDLAAGFGIAGAHDALHLWDHHVKVLISQPHK